jgi:hypothetical protein
MSAALFDPDGIMREVRAQAYPSPAAKTANLLNETPNFSSLAKLAGPTHVAGPALLNARGSWSDRLYEFLARLRPDDTSIERWACACRGVEAFARVWVAKAMSLGWTFDELFALAEPFANPSLQGAAWFVGDSTVTVITGDAITLRTEGDATQRIYRKLHLRKTKYERRCRGGNNACGRISYAGARLVTSSLKAYGFLDRTLDS